VVELTDSPAVEEDIALAVDIVAAEGRRSLVGDLRRLVNSRSRASRIAFQRTLLPWVIRHIDRQVSVLGGTTIVWTVLEKMLDDRNTEQW